MSGEQRSGKHEGPQRMSAGQGGREAGVQQDENKNSLNFSQQQLRNPRPTSPSLQPPPSSFYSHLLLFSPVLLSSENHPEARHSPGWLTPKQSPCSSHAGNNLSLLKEPRLLEGSTHTPPPPASPPLLLSPSASEASGLLPRRRRRSTLLHVPSPLSIPGPNRLLIPPS